MQKTILTFTTIETTKEDSLSEVKDEDDSSSLVDISNKIDEVFSDD